jgi:hypothetical protein
MSNSMGVAGTTGTWTLSLFGTASSALEPAISAYVADVCILLVRYVGRRLQFVIARMLGVFAIFDGVCVCVCVALCFLFVLSATTFAAHCCLCCP